MSALTQMFPKPTVHNNETTPIKKIVAKVKSKSEIFWFTTAFVLFIVMGPFSAIAAVMGVFSFMPGDEIKEPEYRAN